LDYGCGRGHDVAILEAAGISVSGWDPHYRPAGERKRADIVNLGYVLNVIENGQERRDVLAKSAQLATQVLIVSVISQNSNDLSKNTEYGDGLVTVKGTFQKYFRQAEIKELIETTTGHEALAVGSGIFYVFMDKVEEQRFLANRRRKNHDISHLMTLKPPLPGAKTWSDWIMFEAHKDVLAQLWQRMIVLGRLPAVDELPEYVSTRIDSEFGSIRQAAQLSQIGFDSKSFNSARLSRIDDLTVYFALNLFNRRQPYSQLPVELQRDVNVFFQTYRAAQEVAQGLLFSVGNPRVIHQSCEESYDNGVGFLEGSHSLQIHSSLVEQLPPALRTYIGCAEKLYGDVDQSDLVKVHIQSGKVTFLEYEEFHKSSLPRLLRRTKVNLREQGLECFDYQEAAQQQLLYQKSKYLTENMPGFTSQKRFDQQLMKLGLFNFSGFGPHPEVFFATLERCGLHIQGRKLVKT